MSPRRQRLAHLLATTRLLSLLSAHPRWQGLLVLNYHRIGDPAASPLDRGVFSATQEDFDAQLGALTRLADVVRLADLPGVITRRGRHVLLTFDDGYRDNYELAFPVLKRHGLSATFFLCTGFLDQRTIGWWDEIAWMVRRSPHRGVPASQWLPEPLPFDEPEREEAIRTLLARYKALPALATGDFLAYLAEATGSGRYDPAGAPDPWMTWEMAREMVAAGMEVGGHTVTHAILARLGAAEQEREIAGCKARLRAELGREVRAFTYPVGRRDTFDATTRAALARAGFDLAFSFYGGYSRASDWDPYDIPRVAVASEMSLTTVEALVAAPWLIAAPPRLIARPG